MAVKKKVVEIDTKDAQQQVDQLKDSMTGLNQENNAATTSVKELRQELKAQKDILLSTEQGTDEYNAALKKAAEIQHTLREQMEEVNASAMDFGQIASNIGKATGGLVAGLQAAKATMNLFGVENETVIKSLQQMQNLMAITQALPALDNGVKAFKRLSLVIQTATGATSKFGKALISTGLGALAVALGYIIANFEEISKWLDEVTGQTDFLGNLSDKVMGGLQAGWDGLVQTLKAVGGAITTYITAPFKSVWSAIQAYTTTDGGFADKLKAAGKAMKDTFVDDWKDVGDDFKQIGVVATNAYYDGVKSANAKRTAETEEQRKEREKQEKEAAAKLAKEIADIRSKYENLNSSISLYDKSDLEKQLIALDQSFKDEEKILKDAYDKGIINKTTYEEQLTKLQKHYNDLRSKANLDALKKEQEDRINESIKTIDTTYQLEQAKLQKQYDEKLISEDDFNKRKKELQKTYVKDSIDNLQFLLDTEKNLTDEQILDLTNKIHQARASLKENKTETEDPNIVTAKQISEAINASALALNDFSDNPAWGNILKNVATLTANWDTLQKNIEEGGSKAFTAYTQIAATALSAVAQMMNGLAAEQDTSNKEGFESAKKYQIAGATMSMLAGIASAWASSMQLMFPANVIIGSILSAMMLGTGIAQIAKIKSTQFGGGSTSGASATPNASAVSAIQAPVQYTQDVQGANIEGAIKDTRVYVVESDITNAQNRVDVAESENIY